MNWLIIVIIAYFLNALAIIIDKALLKKSIPEPVVYTFYIGLLGLIFIPILIPFGFSLPTLDLILVSLLTGIFFIIALLIFFQALKIDDATQVIPLVGGLSPLIILVLAFFLIGERLTIIELIALLLIVGGTYIISFDQTTTGWRVGSKTLLLTICSSFFFALSYTLSKQVYDQLSFINGFIWIRIGSLLAVFSLLFIKRYRQMILKSSDKTRLKIKWIFIIGQALAGISFFMINYAIFLGSVTLTNALQGLQYVFLFLIIIFLSQKYPQILKEKLNLKIIAQKILAIIFISLGLVFIAY